ncbi:MAG: hypothetical protein HQ464_15355 [Planctomycetes bacterium]|nr:hypothetical protein [Planctomycetota bacterium]
MRSWMWQMTAGAAAAAALLAVGIGLGRWLSVSSGELPRVFAVTSQSDEAFAVCTAPMDNTIEGFFMLDFETGDLSGGVLSTATSRFAASYKHNVLPDLGFKPGGKGGQAKNPKFLLVSGMAELRGGGNANFASSVLYVTDSATGTTVAYGIPWNAQQPLLAGPLVPLDVARPRGGGAKAK